MKRILLILLCLPMIGLGQKTYVPDFSFENYLEANGMGDGIAFNDSVLTASIDTLTYINLGSNGGIVDLTGIEDFTALTYLYCDNNAITSLDVSQNTALIHLVLYANELTSLDVSQNTALTYLSCSNNQLTSLDVSQNTALTYLYCSSNLLTSIDVSQNTALIALNVCGGDPCTITNQFTSLNVSANLALTYLNCSRNHLNNLDVSQNTALTTLICETNYLTSLDVSQNTALTTLYCGGNQLTSLDVRNGNNINFILLKTVGDPMFGNNQNLYCIDVDNAAAIADSANWTNIPAWSSLSINCATAFGCTDSLACNYDTIATIDDLTCVYPSSNSTTATACYSYTWSVDGQTYTASGTYTEISTNANGCDHIETLNLTINYSSSSTDTQVACDTYTWVDGNTYTASNITATHMFQTVDGCDSLSTLDLTINNSSSSTDTHIACDTYSWNGMTYTTSGIYTYSTANSNGCDSTATLNLTINNSQIANIWQTGDELFAITPPNVSVVADWYNIQTQDGITRIWLMEEQSNSFEPTFDCSYFIVIEDDNECIDTSSIFDYAASAKRIGSFTTSPNPTTGLVNVKFDNPKNQFVMFELISNNGSKLDEFITIDNNLNIDLSKYPTGSYYLYFNSEDAVQGCRLEEVQKISTKIILNK